MSTPLHYSIELNSLAKQTDNQYETLYLDYSKIFQTSYPDILKHRCLKKSYTPEFKTFKLGKKASCLDENEAIK